MRTIVTSCLAILLFSAVVSARLGDSAAELLPTVPSTIPTTADVKNFLSGLWDAIGLGHDFDDFSTCIEVDTNAGAQLQKAMTLMGSPSASDVSHGLNKIDKVVSPMIAGIKACNMKDKYTTTINKIVNKFTNPGSLTIQTDSSISINGVEVYADVAAAVDACNKGSFAACGTEIGEGMGKVFYAQDNVTAADAVAQINSIPNITWTAADFTQFKVMNLWEFKKGHINLRRKKNDASIPAESESEAGRRNLATIPVAFDARTNWPTCIHAIRDQGGCGNCWAFGASEVLSDRFCIASNKSVNTVMSAQYLTSCDTTNFACNGGYIDKAWKFLEKNGDVTDTCMPYKSGNGLVPSCSTFTKCADNTRLRKYYAKVNSTRIISTLSSIQNEILTNGPVETGFDVYSDFMSYKTGIYTNTAGASYLGGHAVKIIGWGNSNGINYWIVANSWGTYWGESGFFKIKFGSCGIDRGVIAGLPDLLRQ
jgi:cathepsin B